MEQDDFTGLDEKSGTSYESLEVENLDENKINEESIVSQNENKINEESIVSQNENKSEFNQIDKKKLKINKAEILQFLKFLAFSLSAGVIQLLSFELLYNWTNALPWWPSYLISIILSVIWNFTFNRKFTFKSASNVPISMTLALCFYVIFIPVSVFGGDALETSGWNGTLVTILMMVINFILEFFWDKFIVFNDKIVASILKAFKFKKITSVDQQKPTENKEQDNQTNEVDEKSEIVEGVEEN